MELEELFCEKHPTYAMIYLLCYATIMCTLVLLRERGQSTSLAKFLVADRRMGGVIGAMSIAASWIWAPAVFVSSRAGYEWGYSGLVWFIVPNMLALVIFAPLAEKLRNVLPEGYSYVQSLRDRGGYFRETQLTMQLILQVMIYAIQLTAGADLLSTITGSNYYWLAIGMGIIPFAYTFFSGLRTSVFTDAVQYCIIFISSFLILAAFPAELYSPDPRPFRPFDTTILINFGVSSALGLIVAIFADHQQWQRVFAIKTGSVAKTYYTAALLHGVITLILGTLGSLVYKEGFQVSGRIELVAIEFIHLHYSPIYTYVFIALTLSALISTLDSGLCAFSSLYMTEKSEQKLDVKNGRKLMLVLAVAGICLSQVHLSLVTLWFIAGTIRLATFFPTILSVLFKSYPSRIGTASIYSGLTIGGSIFGYGIWLGDSKLRTIGMIMSVTISGLISMFSVMLHRENSSAPCSHPRPL